MQNFNSTKRPVIGIACDLEARSTFYKLPLSYRQAVENAGGLPILLPATDADAVQDQYIGVIHGLMLPGGDDLDSQLYHQTAHSKNIESHPLRQQFDMAMLRKCEEAGIPILAICMGCQTLNVMRGGDLIQYLPEFARHGAVPHAADPAVTTSRNAWHKVQFKSGSKLAGVYQQTEIEVNSRHRQAIGTLGTNLRLSASAPDGIIEAVEDVSLPFCIGVQWHPENLTAHPGDRLFAAFIGAAAQYAGFGA